MKKILVLVILISAFQFSQAQHPHIGLKAGVNFSNLKFKGFDASDYKAGLNAGLLGHIHLSKDFALQPELFYSMQGGKYEVAGNEFKTKLSYINLPVLVQYMFGDGFRVQAGPQLGFLVGADQSFNDVETDVKDNFKSIDISLPLGISYISHSGLGIDARWVFGLSDINDAVGGAKTYNNGAQVGLFYIFGTSHKPKAMKK